MERRKLLIGLGLALFVSIVGVVVYLYTRSERPVVIVGVRGDRLVIIHGESETVIHQSDYTIYPLEANSRGELLYMSVSPDRQDAKLFIFDGVESRLVTEEFLYYAPPHFLGDNHVAYLPTNASSDQLRDESGRTYHLFPIVQHDLKTGKTREIGTYRPYSFGSDRTIYYAMDQVLFEERLTGFFNTALYNSDIRVIGILGADPDGGRVLSFSVTRETAFLNFIDVETGLTTQLRHITVGYSNLHWDEDDWIYFGTRTGMDPTYTPLTEAEAAAFGWKWDTSTHAEIIKVDSETDEETTLYQADNVWAITRLNIIDDYLYWAEIPDGTAVIEALRNGDITEGDKDMIIATYLLPDVYRMPLEGGDPELVAEDLQRFLPIPAPDIVTDVDAPSSTPIPTPTVVPTSMFTPMPTPGHPPFPTLNPSFTPATSN